jgi:ElaB/YqjD/DUF883 family membrane-anchored ribosome-binding protein
MEAIHELAERELVEQSSDEMREEIDSTRSGLADKLDALEDRVMGTVQSAQETVEDSIQIAKDTMATVKRTFDIKHHVEQYPWAMVGGCFLAGLALGALFQRSRRRRQTADGRAGEKAGFSARPARTKQRDNGSFASAAPQYQSPPPSRAGWFDLFHDEIAKVKGMAIGYVLGLARDALKDAVPQWAPQVDGVMNSVTTKLGGEPSQERGQ